MLLFLLAALAGAADLAAPTVTIHDNGSVVGLVDLGVTPEQVQSALSDPTWLPTITGDGTRVTLQGTDGGCQLLASESPSAIMTARYETRRCPTDTGFQSTLRSSNAFKTYATSWTFTPTAQGTRATYRLDMTTSLWVPNSVVRRATRNALEDMLTQLQAWSKTTP